MARSLQALPSRHSGQILAGVILALGLIGLTTARAAPEVKLSQAQMQNLGIRVAHPISSRTDQTLAFPAQIVVPTSQLWVVSAPVAGMVTSLSVARGDQVQRGQQLVSLESPSFVSLQREYLHAVQQEVLLTQQLRRNTELFEGKAAPWRVVEASQTEARQASFAVAERRQMLRLSGMSDAAISRLTSEAAHHGDAVGDGARSRHRHRHRDLSRAAARTIGPAPEACAAVAVVGRDRRAGIQRARHPTRRARGCRRLRYARPGRAGLGDDRCRDPDGARPRRSAEHGRAAAGADRCRANRLSFARTRPPGRSRTTRSFGVARPRPFSSRSRAAFGWCRSRFSPRTRTTWSSPAQSPTRTRSRSAAYRRCGAFCRASEPASDARTPGRIRAVAASVRPPGRAAAHRRRRRPAFPPCRSMHFPTSRRSR